MDILIFQHGQEIKNLEEKNEQFLKNEE